MRPDGYLLPAGEVMAEAIIEEVARGFGVSVDDMLGSSQCHHIHRARVCAMAAIREATPLSFPVIGRIFGRNHTTVMHHVAKVMSNPDAAAGVFAVIDELRSGEGAAASRLTGLSFDPISGVGFGPHSGAPACVNTRGAADHPREGLST